MPLGPSQQYLAQFNSQILPGYVQDETFDSSMNIENHYAPYADGSLSEYTGLQNKILSLRLKVWEPDYEACKDEVQRAATIVRSSRTFAPLYVQKSDRYYEALTQSIKMQKTAGESVRTLDYEVQFECKPWYYSVSGYTITGTGTINTDQVGRTIDDGGFTAATITLTGTNVTLSGYNELGAFTGYLAVSGAVSNLIIDSDAFTATMGGNNANEYMYTPDYRLWVGPGKSYFTSTGASSVSITYRNRWYL